MAMCDSVTVSMAALMMGMFSRILREIWVWVFAVAGTTSECAGRSNTSSNVRASGTGKWIIEFGLNFYCREQADIRQIRSNSLHVIWPPTLWQLVFAKGPETRYIPNDSLGSKVFGRLY